MLKFCVRARIAEELQETNKSVCIDTYDICPGSTNAQFFFDKLLLQKRSYFYMYDKLMSLHPAHTYLLAQTLHAIRALYTLIKYNLHIWMQSNLNI